MPSTRELPPEPYRHTRRRRGCPPVSFRPGPAYPGASPREEEGEDMWEWLGTEFLSADFTFAREVLQRGIGAVYVIAFIAALRQFPALLGERGLLPAPRFLGLVSARQAPSLFHWRYSDRLVRTVAWLGLVLAAAVIAGLPQPGPWWVPMLVFLALYGLYLSIVNIGQIFYGFGWESLLLETGFVAAFLSSHQTGVPLVTIFAFRWLLFRVELDRKSVV